MDLLYFVVPNRKPKSFYKKDLNNPAFLKNIMKKSKLFSEEELLTIYRIIKPNIEEYSNKKGEVHNDYYDEYEEPIQKKLAKTILDKIEEQIPQEQIIQLNKTMLRRKYHTYNSEIDYEVYETLKQGLKERRTVEIKYFDMKTAEFIKRKIDVYHTTQKYTEAYCHLRKANRTFRTSRITNAKLTTQTYSLPGE